MTPDPVAAASKQVSTFLSRDETFPDQDQGGEYVDENVISS
jgi:hypothetical protein